MIRLLLATVFANLSFRLERIEDDMLPSYRFVNRVAALADPAVVDRIKGRFQAARPKETA